MQSSRTIIEQSSVHLTETVRMHVIIVRIMYWCLHNNEVLFSFLGHSDLIIDLSMNPTNDLFLSTSRDKTSRLWDLSRKICLCIFQDSNWATFDDTGKVIASITSDTEKGSDKVFNYINLYNTESVLKGPFKVFKIDMVTTEIKQVKFANDGTFMICTTNENLILVVDAYEGSIVNRLTGDINESDALIKADVSADSKYIASGSENGNILIWNKDGNLVSSLDCHPQISNVAKFSPKFSLLASACTNLVLWHPSLLFQ
jgi:COMPASS component SWD2